MLFDNKKFKQETLFLLSSPFRPGAGLSISTFTLGTLTSTSGTLTSTSGTLTSTSGTFTRIGPPLPEPLDPDPLPEPSDPDSFPDPRPEPRPDPRPDPCPDPCPDPFLYVAVTAPVMVLNQTCA